MIVRDPTEFRREAEKIERVIRKDAQLPEQVLRSPAARVYFIDLDDLWSEEWFQTARSLAVAVGATTLVVGVLKPDPTDYYHKNFEKFPFLKFDVSSTSGKDYIAALHEDPGDSPADAIVHNFDVVVVYPDNMRLMIYGERDLEIAILAVIDDDAVHAVESIYPKERLYSARGAVNQILPRVYRGPVPDDLQAKLLRNYDRVTAA